MNWQSFQTHNEAPTHAFEVMCNQLFELWGRRTYDKEIDRVSFINGAGGDGGVEAYIELKNKDIIGVQAKWFPDNITDSRITQIKNSIETAMSVRPKIIRYIVCIPRDLASSKKGKNGTIVQDTEEQRWCNLKDKMNKVFPDVQLELWDETRLLQELQHSEAEGIQRYWFEKNEFASDIIKSSFERQKGGWLAVKYIPTLHCKGKIKDKINRFLGDTRVCHKYLSELDNLINTYKELIDNIMQLIDLENSIENTHINLEVLEENKQQAKYNWETLNLIREEYVNEKLIELEDLEEVIEHSFSSLRNLLAEHEHIHDSCYAHVDDIIRTINKIIAINQTFSLKNLIERTNYNKVIIEGEPGTGKTHGVANIVETLIETEHIPILIQAKNISLKDTWEDIIHSSLGLSSIWDRNSLWTALETMSYRKQNEYIRKNPKQDIVIIPKVVIFVDGIDECRPYDKWIERMREVDVICHEHPRIRFCFSCRSYVFSDLSFRDPLLCNKLILPSDGDCSVAKLFNNYMREYEIDISKVKWIKWVIKTPLALRLFCEIYQNKSIEAIDPACMTIANLIRAKIDNLDSEYREIYNPPLGKKDFVINKCLRLLEETLLNRNECTRDELIDKLDKEPILGKISNKDDLLCFLENNGLIQSYIVEKTNLIQPPSVYYSLGMQSIYDYIAATRVMDNIINLEGYNWSNISFNTGVMQMLAVILLEDKNILIWKYRDSIKQIRANVFDLTCFALVNASAKRSNRYIDIVKEIMRKNATYLKVIINRILIYTTREDNNMLNAGLLHEYMMTFNKPAQRDLIWSLPPNLSEPWSCYEQLNLENEEFQLNSDDAFDGVPLIYAWGLATTVNKDRVFFRKKLAGWAKDNPMEFYKLFNLAIETNDPQMQVELYGIAMTTCYASKNNREYVDNISRWIRKNVFADEKIQMIRNAAIRYYCRVIEECAYSIGLIDEKEVKKCCPPYKHGNEVLGLSIPAMKGTRMGGYGPINYDLARYVLCDPITNRLFSTSGNKIDSNIQQLLENHVRVYGVNSLNASQFIISAAYSYLCCSGWNEKEDEVLGLDRAIKGRYRQEDHGNMSQVMTIAEKYIWCAKHEIMGYLADRLKYDNYEHGKYLVDDYGLLENYPNPILELYQDDPDILRENTEWFIPEALFKADSINVDTWDDVEQLIQAAPAPIFEKWINMKDEEKVMLYSYTCIKDPICNVESLMWISTGVVKKDDLQLFINDIKNSNRVLWNIINNPEEFHSYPEANCYISPMEVCWLKYKKEYNGVEHIESLNGKEYVIKKAISECTTNLLDYGDIYYKLPSKYIRDILRIEDGNGYLYYDKEEQIIAEYTVAGEKWYDAQNILKVDKNILYDKLMQRQEQLFWIVRVKREVSRKLSEKFNNNYIENDRIWVVFYINNKWEAYEYTYNPDEDMSHEIVYIDLKGSGTKYHKAGCRYIRHFEMGT